MKYYYILWSLILLIVYSCEHGENVNYEYKEKFSENWQQVADSILSSWHLSKVDPVKSTNPTSLPLRKKYFSIMPGRNVLFGWDTYFTNMGLLQVDSLQEYVRNAIENHFQLIDSLGFVPNASETWGTNRSQVPFLAMSVKSYYDKNPDKEWLKNAYEYLVKDYQFWTNSGGNTIENHQTNIEELQHFYHHATEEEMLAFYEQIAPRFELDMKVPDSSKFELANAWLAEAESGMDFTTRFEGRCHQFAALDLNCNLFQYEKILGFIEQELSLPDNEWSKKAAKRGEAIIKYCWNEETGLFYDYDFINKRHSRVASVATFYPLYDGVASEEQAASVIDNLHLFENEYGPTICQESEDSHLYQWDYPAGWPPIFFIVHEGLKNYGNEMEAKRVATKYMDLVAKNFENPSPLTYVNPKSGDTVERERYKVYEKYNTVTGQILDSEYISRPFHGWSYGVFFYFYQLYGL